MPNLKPLTKLVTKARDLREQHMERHRPSGFAFAIADSIDYLDEAHWKKVTAHDSLFFSRRYLRVRCMNQAVGGDQEVCIADLIEVAS